MNILLHCGGFLQLSLTAHMLTVGGLLGALSVFVIVLLLHPKLSTFVFVQYI